jgi:hypothetical protein
MRVRLGMALVVAGTLATAGLASADVKTTEKSQLKFEGMLGRVMGLFGGKAMKEGVVSTVAVKGDRKITTTDDAATIIDLAEQKIYEVNIRDKSYKVITFAEMKKQMEDARARAEEQARKQQGREEKKDPNQKEMEIEFSAKETGEKRQINGFNCRQVIMTVAMHEKGKTLEQAGGMLMTLDSWLAPRVPAMKEIQDFDLRYAKAMADALALPSAEQMAQAFAMYPGMKDAMVRMQKESVNMDGTPIETISTFQTVMTKEQAAQAKKDEGQGGGGSPAGAIGGMLGRFGKKKEEPKPAEGGTAKASSESETRATLMTGTHSLLSVASTVSVDEVTVPASFKLKK